MTTLTVTVGEKERLEGETVERIRNVQEGETLRECSPALNFEDYETLARFLTEANLHLLDAIVKEEPTSIRQTARLVDRDYREVHRNLTQLESLGLVRFEGGGQGIAKRPIVPYDDVEISFSIGEDPSTRTSASP